MAKLKLEPNFQPAYTWIKNFLKGVEESGKGEDLKLALERNDGYTYVYNTRVYQKGINDDDNIKYVERLVKSLLWIVGGWKLYVSGQEFIYTQLKEIYSRDGFRVFDVDFMESLYEKPFTVVHVEDKDFPEAKECSQHVGGHLEGNRIGFDAGGSDIKVSSVINGEVTYSNEIVWLPKFNDDPNYHYEKIKEAMMDAANHMPSVDAIGISSAGIYINNKIMTASLFIKCNRKDTAINEKIKSMYTDIVRDHFHNVPVIVANDGDVSALAGAMSLNDNKVLGLAMGTSEAAGYLDGDGCIKGWLNELAFVPVDFNPLSMEDEWSGDYGCGVKYFSQDSVIKLAPRAGIELDPNLTPAEKLKVVQALMKEDDPRARQIYETIGVYLANALAYYSMFYDMKYALLLGRVMSGKGGDIIVEVCNKTLETEFPEVSVKLTLPDEKFRRVGQSIAAASLPATK